MNLTPAQLTTLKVNILANVTPIPVGQPFAGTLVNAVPNNGDGNAQVAWWYNQTATPNFWVWRTNVSRRDVYFTVPDTNSAFDFVTYKAQAVPEQGAWTQMFMGDAADFGNIAMRNGVFAVFSGNAAQNLQRAHIFAVGRRVCNRAEKIFAVAPSSAGGIVVGPNNGNTITDLLGATTNSAVMPFEGSITASEVRESLNLV